MRRLISWLYPFRSENGPSRLAEAAFRAKYPSAALHHVEAVAEDSKSYFVQVLYDSASCRMASFWRISKAGFEACELRASDLNRLFVNPPALAAEEDLRSHAI